MNSKDALSALAPFRIKLLGTDPDSIASNGKTPVGFASDLHRLCGAIEFCSDCSMQTVSFFFLKLSFTIYIFLKTFGSLP